jgi:hypothetical protein
VNNDHEEACLTCNINVFTTFDEVSQE